MFWSPYEIAWINNMKRQPKCTSEWVLLPVIPLSVEVEGSIHLASLMQCTNRQTVPCVLAEFVHARSNNWAGQRWTNWFVAVAKIIEQFLSLMLVVCCWLTHTLWHTHTHTLRWRGLLRTGCSLKSSSNNEAPNRSHQSLSREILVTPTFLPPHPHMLEEAEVAYVFFCPDVSMCARCL